MICKFYPNTKIQRMKKIDEIYAEYSLVKAEVKRLRHLAWERQERQDHLDLKDPDKVPYLFPYLVDKYHSHVLKERGEIPEEFITLELVEDSVIKIVKNLSVFEPEFEIIVDHGWEKFKFEGSDVFYQVRDLIQDTYEKSDLKKSILYANPVQKFKNCRHGLLFKQCKSCQMLLFLMVQKQNGLSYIFRDLNKMIFSMLDDQERSMRYCCRCETGFEILDNKELEDYGYRHGSLKSNGCDSIVWFGSTMTIRPSIYESCQFSKLDDCLIQSGFFSKYGTDGYTMTAGFFADEKEKRTTEEQTIERWGVAKRVLVCDGCIGEMRANGELQDSHLKWKGWGEEYCHNGDGVNEGWTKE